MSIFYINDEKNSSGEEFSDKYDLGKFIDGTSDTPVQTKQRIRQIVSGVTDSTTSSNSTGILGG